MSFSSFLGTSLQAAGTAFSSEAYLIYVDAGGGNLVTETEIRKIVDGVIKGAPEARVDLVVTCEFCEDRTSSELNEKEDQGSYSMEHAYIVPDVQKQSKLVPEIWGDLERVLENQKRSYEHVEMVDRYIAANAFSGYNES